MCAFRGVMGAGMPADATRFLVFFHNRWSHHALSWSVRRERRTRRTFVDPITLRRAQKSAVLVVTGAFEDLRRTELKTSQTTKYVLILLVMWTRCRSESVLILDACQTAARNKSTEQRQRHTASLVDVARLSAAIRERKKKYTRV